MADPQFTAIDIKELPAKVRLNTVSDEDKALAATVAGILATGKAARSGESFTSQNADDATVKTTKRKATDAGTKIKGLITRLATTDATFPFHGKMSVRTITLTPTSFTFALVPSEESTPEEEATETPPTATVAGIGSPKS